MKEASVILIKCIKAKNTFGATIEKMSDGDWHRVWAFPIKEQFAKNEGFDKTPVKGNLYITEDYPGCPYCKTNGFIQCGTCKKISCYNNEEALTCPWCNTRITNIATAEDKFDVSGGDF